MNLNEKPIALLIGAARRLDGISKSEASAPEERRAAERKLTEIELMLMGKLNDAHMVKNAALDVARAERSLASAKKLASKTPERKVSKLSRKLREAQRVEQNTAMAASILASGSRDILDAALGRKKLAELDISLRPFAASLGAV